MSEVALIGIDLAKRVFQMHGARCHGSVAFRKKLSRGQLLAFMGVISPFLTGCGCRTYAAIFSFCAGVMPPMPIFGRSLL